MDIVQFEHKQNFGEFLEWEFVPWKLHATPIDNRNILQLKTIK